MASADSSGGGGFGGGSGGYSGGSRSKGGVSDKPGGTGLFIGSHARQPQHVSKVQNIPTNPHIDPPPPPSDAEPPRSWMS